MKGGANLAPVKYCWNKWCAEKHETPTATNVHLAAIDQIEMFLRPLTDKQNPEEAQLPVHQ